MERLKDRFAVQPNRNYRNSLKCRHISVDEKNHLPSYYPKVSLSSFNTSSYDKSCGICWMCTFICCCLPLCYPCYFTKIRRTRKQYRKSQIHHSYYHPGFKGCFTSFPMKPGKSTGISGYGTLLSRNDTAQSLLPNIDFLKLQDMYLRGTNRRLRKDVSVIFIPTNSSTLFLHECQSSGLLCKEETGSKIMSDQSSDPVLDAFNEDSRYSVLKDAVFNYLGYVDVSEDNIASRVYVKGESIASLYNPYPSELADIYCRQLAKTDMIVLLVDENDEIKMQGLIDFVSAYWAGYFPLLLVSKGGGKKHITAFITKVFKSIHVVKQDGGSLRAKLFSSVIKVMNRIRVTGLFNGF